jgi:hypothetical protein
VAYDDGFQIVAALTLQGRAFEHLYTVLADIPTEASLGPDLTKQYKEGVKVQYAEKNRIEAIKNYQVAVDKGLELQAYGPAMVTAQTNLARLKGDKNQGGHGRAILMQLPDWRGL